MKIKKAFALATTILILALQVAPVGAIAQGFVESNIEPPEEDEDYYIDSFVISAYYSPLLNQDRYVTGSHAGDVRLNGNGTNGADGTEVFPGMIACPKNYSFGTKFFIPGIGMSACHDRGGAIVSKDGPGDRGYAFDRLDVWMGAGDEGLVTALQWGKRTVNNVRVYGVRPDIPEDVYFDEINYAEVFIQQTVLSPLHFKKDIYFGTDGDEVTELQEYLVEWGYLEVASGFFGEDTRAALAQFQDDFEISTNDLNSGHFGINTRTKFDALLNDEDPAVETIKLQNGRTLMAQKYVDLFEEERKFAASLGLGDSSAEVMSLQEELIKLGFLRIEPSGYYGESTQHAVYKFQQATGVVADATQLGAGHVGPATRAMLNGIMSERFDIKSVLAYQREEVAQKRHIVAMPNEELVLKEDEASDLE